MQIRKANLKYVKCKGGDMHSGQVMNLVCVDQRCHYRGLICPICKMESHDDHYILPIKAFLDEISKSFLKNEENDEMNTIGDYLRSLENTRKELLATIKNQIVELSNLFKDLECKVEEVYLSLRRNILIQSTINTKLPSLIQLMRKENNYDDFDIQQQFKKYCELIKFKDSKLNFSDKSKKLVNFFQEIPKKFNIAVKQSLAIFTKEIKQQNSSLQLQNIDKKIQNSQKQFKFSSTDKHSCISVSEDKKEATSIGKGFIFLDNSLSQQNNKFSFTVHNHDLEQIIVGVGDIDKFRTYEFNNNQDFSCVQLFASSDGHNSLIMLDDSGSQSSVYNQNALRFNDPQSKVSVQYNASQQNIVFTNANTSQKLVMKLKENIEGSSKWKVFFGINDKDKISIQTQ